MYLFPYNFNSKSAANLAEGLGFKRIRLENSKFVGGPNKTVINWGNSKSTDEINRSRVINKPEAVGLVTNKLKFFNSLDYSTEKFVVPFTTDKHIAQTWVDKGGIAVGRSVLQGHSGEGIILFQQGDVVTDLPLYTKYIPKQSEYRVHVVRDKNGEVKAFDAQRKARNKSVPDEEVNWRIRNHANGFVYVRGDSPVNLNGRICNIATTVFSKTGLDFGAVDIIYTKKGDAYVLEINTAPGLEGTTLTNYIDMIKENFL